MKTANKKPDMFGLYCKIEMHRDGAKNEFYKHKVINRIETNFHRSVPLKWHDEGTINPEGCQVVLSVVCCGVDESRVFRVKLSDVEIL